jgi:hypothetical protein
LAGTDPANHGAAIIMAVAVAAASVIFNMGVFLS